MQAFNQRGNGSAGFGDSDFIGPGGYQQPSVASSSPLEEWTVPAQPQAPGPAPDLATGRNPRIVVGFDYGTTHTGLVFMIEGAGIQPSFRNLQVHDQWPNRGSTEKVLSAYSYSPSQSGQHEQWGFDIDDNSVVLKWTKLELPRRSTDKELSELVKALEGLDLIKAFLADNTRALENDIPEHLCKSPTDVIRDFVDRVTRQWHGSMVATSRDQFKTSDLDIVITHPANWGWDAINATVRAIRGGFDKHLFPKLRNVSLVPEPEAAALHIIQSLLETQMNELNVGESFVVCDAGGGTVDLVTYRLGSLQPLEITKVGAITGRECGATFIDRAFLEWIEGMLVEPEEGQDSPIMSQDMGAGGHYVVKPAGRVLLSRFETYKTAFTGVEDSVIQMPDNLEFEPGTEGDQGNGQLTITKEKMRELFRMCVDSTKELLAGQITVARQRRERPTNIFMTGGFSLSPYLYQEVTAWANRRSLRVKRPSNCWIAVAGGAVLHEMGIGSTTLPKTGLFPMSYGVCTTETYRRNTQPRHGRTAVDAYTGQAIGSKKTVAWLVKKGDIIPPENATGGIDRSVTLTCRYCEPLRYDVPNRFESDLKFSIVAADEEDDLDVRGQENFLQVADLRVPVSKIPREMQYYRLGIGGSKESAYRETNFNICAKSSGPREAKISVKCGSVELASYKIELP